MNPRARAEQLSAAIDSAPLESQQIDLIERAIVDAVAEERRNIAAYLLDRADQYTDDSACWVALGNVCEAIINGGAYEAAMHGELDDLYERVDDMLVSARGDGSAR